MVHRALRYSPESELIEEAKQADLPGLLARWGWPLKREGRSYRVRGYGGLILWPAQDGTWRWTWFSRGEGGDAISLLTHPDLAAMDFKAAVEALAGKPWPERIGKAAAREPRPKPPRPAKSQAQGELEKWRKKAEAFVRWAHDNLMSEQSERVRKWLRECRGLTEETASKFQIGFCPKAVYRKREDWGLPHEKDDRGRLKRLWLPPGLVIPRYDHRCGLTGVTIRLFKPDEARTYGLPTVAGCEIRYYSLPSPYPREIWTSSLFSWPIAIAERRPLVIVESELDAILLVQEVGDYVSVAALGSAGRRPRDLETNRDFWWLFVQSPTVLLVLDNDEAGQVAVQWWIERYRHVRPWPVPQGKDPTEFFLAGGDLKTWLLEGFERGSVTGWPRLSLALDVLSANNQEKETAFNKAA